MRSFRLAAVLLVSLAPCLPASGFSRRPDPGFPLFAAANVLLRGNRVACNINDLGEQCVNATNPTDAGGFWPRGTRNQYVFVGGMQVSGIIGGVDGPEFPWPGDTVGAFFFDPRGGQQHGAAVTQVFDGLHAPDLLAWPEAAWVADPSLFHAGALGGPTASSQDTWVRYWDESPVVSGRLHPFGILVEQRTLAWNTPGLEDVIFFVYRFVNVSASSPAVYQPLAAAGYTPAAIAELAELGTRFQAMARLRFGVTIPAGGYPVRDFHVAYAQDPDVTANAGNNFAGANLIFRAGLAYSGAFQAERTFSFPPNLHGGPMATAPGLVAGAWLRTPSSTSALEVPITLVSNMANAVFPDHRDVQQLWRRASVNLNPNDGFCVANAAQRQFCFIGQAVGDRRYWMAVGPTSLAPGESRIAVMALVLAAPASAPLTPGVVTPPGLPLHGARLAAGLDQVNTLDRIAGWLGHNDLDADGVIEIDEVTTLPRSLLWKIQRANVIARNGFLVPQPPTPPAFTVIPGSGAVTITWEPSATEAAGDPYYQLASNPLLATFDPDYRQHDLEGYRIWRGTSPGTMQVVAQFDLSGTSITDHAGLFRYGFQCAPDLGITTSCPAFPLSHPLSGEVVMVPPGERFANAAGIVTVLAADTAATKGGRGRLPLRDTGIPYVYTDTGLLNGRVYYYAVTAFDVNSVASAPATLDSPLQPRAVQPRFSASAAGASLATVHAVPDPYYMQTSLEPAGTQVLRLVNLPERAVVRIYSSSGVLVAILNHNDPSGGGEATWDLRNRGGRRVSSGIYFFHVEASDGRRRSGRFVVINRR